MFNMILFNFPHEKTNVKYISNNSYTRVFIRPRTVTKLRTLGQLRHRSVAILDYKPCYRPSQEPWLDLIEVDLGSDVR